MIELTADELAAVTAALILFKGEVVATTYEVAPSERPAREKVIESARTALVKVNEETRRVGELYR